MDYSARHKKFRDLLRQIRVEAGLTQVELTEKLGKPQSCVSKVEQGERRMDFLETVDFCQACAAELDTLLEALVK